MKITKLDSLVYTVATSAVLWLAVSIGSTQTLAPEFAGPYTVRKLGGAPGIPTSYGGMVFKSGETNTLLLGGQANGSSASIYAIQVQRGADGHITGFSGTGSYFADAGGVSGGGIDGGLEYGPGGVLFFTTYDDNTLGQLKPGSTAVDKHVVLSDFGIPYSVGALTFVPPGFPGAGRLKITSYAGYTWYDTTLVPDAQGTYDVAIPSKSIEFPDKPEGIFYVKAGSPQFPRTSVLIGFYSRDIVRAYEVDANGDPIVGTVRDFITNLTGITGATRDPKTGDFLFSSFSDENIYVVGGFSATPPQVSITSPVEGATFTVPAYFSVEAQASQQGGSIDRVEFFLNQQALEVSRTPPYTAPVSGVSAGSYTLYAVAYDGSGQSATSSVVHVTVKYPALQVNLVTPANGATMSICGPLVLTAQITGGAAITNVSFFDGAVELRRLTQAPWYFRLSHISEGTHDLSVRATDATGASSVSSISKFTVQPLPLNTLVPHALSAAELLLCFKGQPGTNYVWEKTDDLIKPWQPYLTNDSPLALQRVTNTFSVTIPTGFYRVRTGP